MSAEDTDAAAHQAPGLRVGFVPGVTVTKWERIWDTRFGAATLSLQPITQATQETLLRCGQLDMCFVRSPLPRTGLHIIPLYRETPVVVAPRDHPIAVFDTVTMQDLVDEQLHSAADLDGITDTIALVAAGVGLVIIPHSLARLHARRDVVYRPVNAPDTGIGLAWLAEETTEWQERFIGVVRGRTERSSRGG